MPLVSASYIFMTSSIARPFEPASAVLAAIFSEASVNLTNLFDRAFVIGEIKNISINAISKPMIAPSPREVTVLSIISSVLKSSPLVSPLTSVLEPSNADIVVTVCAIALEKTTNFDIASLTFFSPIALRTSAPAFCAPAPIPFVKRSIITISPSVFIFCVNSESHFSSNLSTSLSGNCFSNSL